MDLSFSASWHSAAPALTAVEEGEGAAPGQDGGFNGYGDGATYGNNNSFGRGGAGTGDYYNDPQYGVNVVGGPQSADKDRIIYFS